jgi:hypothetical protein
MTQRIEEQFVQSKGKPKQINDDRFTLVFQAHYLEMLTGQTTIARWAYDRLHPSQDSCSQNNIRIQPGIKTPIPIPGDWGKFELLLAHKMPQMQADVDGPLAEQQKLNVIEIWDGEKMIAELKPDRMAFGHFKGPLFASSTRATAILHITAFPA